MCPVDPHPPGLLPRGLRGPWRPQHPRKGDTTTFSDTTQTNIADYPTTWKGYVGQEGAKSVLQVAAKSARMRKQPMDHVLIAHPTPGLGKTSIALLVAKEMRTEMRVVSGQVTADKARMLFSDMEDGDVLFIDEFHRMMDGGKRNIEWLLHYLQDGVIMGPLGPEQQPRITIVAATTNAGKLPATVVDRFGIQPPMDEYSDVEAIKIVQLMAKRILVGLPKISTKQAGEIAAATANNPRKIRRLVTVLRDLTITKTLPLLTATKYDIAGLLASQNITADGLDRTAQQYLNTLRTEFGGSAGAKALEDRLGNAGGLGDLERMLMDKGYVAKTRTGRSLTQAGIKRSIALASPLRSSHSYSKHNT